MKTEENLIGAKYIPQDNSYSRNLSNERGEAKKNLAGTVSSKAEIVTIISKPFQIEMTTVTNRRDAYLFVLVLDSCNDTYLYMWHPHGLITKEKSADDILGRMQYANPFLYDY